MKYKTKYHQNDKYAPMLHFLTEVKSTTKLQARALSNLF